MNTTLTEQQADDWLDSAKKGWGVDDIEPWLFEGRKLGPGLVKALEDMQDRPQPAFRSTGIKIALNRFIENANAHHFPFFWEPHPLVKSSRDLRDLPPSTRSVRIDTAAQPAEAAKTAEGLSRLPNLESLWICGPDQAEFLQSAHATAIKNLILETGRVKKYNLGMLSGFENVEFLQVFAESFDHPGALAGLRSLRSLFLQGAVSDLDFLSCLDHLRYLRLKGYKAEAFGPLAALPHLEALYLDSPARLIDLAQIKACLPQLVELGLWDARLLENVSELRNAAKLKKLKIHGLPKATDFSALPGMGRLSDLRLSKCGKLTKVDFIKQLGGVVHFDFSSMPPLPSLSVFSPLNKLKRLNLVGTRIKDKSYQPLHSLKNLLVLNAWRLSDSEMNALRKRQPDLILNGQPAWKE